ncbi:unnamed protein product [Ranitomeya imitator]|uniref:BDHCT domain-containing protein n=1 Tax=Ranitomeya imitator TaxID=111125 RepID=A0ABN9L5X4_9NEOB|nr:unnamed protein product [Ranitomeya imitator]
MQQNKVRDFFQTTVLLKWNPCNVLVDAKKAPMLCLQQSLQKQWCAQNINGKISAIIFSLPSLVQGYNLFLVSFDSSLVFTIVEFGVRLFEGPALIPTLGPEPAVDYKGSLESYNMAVRQGRRQVHVVRLYVPFSMRVVVVYRPPGPSHQFLDHFATWLPHFLSCDTPTLIMGDFNIPIASPLSPSASHLLALTSSFGLSQHTNSPTHEDGNSLDLVFSRLCSVDDFTNSPLPLSDHHLLSFSIKNCHPAQVTPTFHTYRNIQAINTQELMKNLQSSLAPISSISCPDSALKHYNETLQSALDEAAPPIHKTTRHRRQQPWHTLQTRFLQRCSRCAERLWRKSNLPEDFIHYKFMLKTYNSALHLSKQTYFNTLITSLSNNPKRLFDTFQSLLNPRAQAPTTDLRADNLANYFKEKIDHIRQEIISQSLHTMHCPPSPTASSSLSDFEPVTEEEYHLYADDTQLYTSSPDLTPALLENTSDCLTAVSSIMSSLYLKLNLSKTELLVFSPSTNLPLPDIAISVCGSTITPKQHARCLGVILDSDLSFTPHIRSLARSSYLHLKNISRIRPFLTFDSAKTLTVSLIHSRLDYCNSLLIGLPLTKLSPLQSVLNAAARIIFLTNRYTDASTLCQSLHWLPIHSRIQYKTTTLIHKALHGSAPPYISSLVSVYHPTRALRSTDDLSAKVTVDAVCDDDIDADDLAEVILPEDEYDEDFIPPSPTDSSLSSPPALRGICFLGKSSVSSGTAEENTTEHLQKDYVSATQGQEVSPELYAVMLDICKLVDRIPTTELLFLSCRKELQKQMDIWKRLSSNDSVLKSSLVEPRCLSSGSKPSDSKIDSAPGFLGTLVSDASVQRPLGNVFRFTSLASDKPKPKDITTDCGNMRDSRLENKLFSFKAYDCTSKDSSSLQDSVFISSRFNTPYSEKPLTSSTCAKAPAPQPDTSDMDDMYFDIDNFDIEDFDDDIQCLDSPAAPPTNKPLPSPYPTIREAPAVQKSNRVSLPSSGFTSKPTGTSDSFIKPPIENPAHERFRGYNFSHSKEMMKIFHKKFGLHRFRMNQLEAINASLCGEDCFILMPTAAAFYMAQLYKEHLWGHNQRAFSWSNGHWGIPRPVFFRSFPWSSERSFRKQEGLQGSRENRTDHGNHSLISFGSDPHTSEGILYNLEGVSASSGYVSRMASCQGLDALLGFFDASWWQQHTWSVSPNEWLGEKDFTHWDHLDSQAASSAACVVNLAELLSSLIGFSVVEVLSMLQTIRDSGSSRDSVLDLRKKLHPEVFQILKVHFKGYGHPLDHRLSNCGLQCPPPKTCVCRSKGVDPIKLRQELKPDEERPSKLFQLTTGERWPCLTSLHNGWSNPASNGHPRGGLTSARAYQDDHRTPEQSCEGQMEKPSSDHVRLCENLSRK